MAKEPLDLEELWALQDAEGHDARGHDLDILVPSKDPEFGPYSDHRFAPGGSLPPAGWRNLTPDEIREAMESEAGEE